MARATPLRTHLADALADGLLATVAFAGPAAALALPRLPRLGLRPPRVQTLRQAYRARWLSGGLALAALGLLLRRRRSVERRAALGAEALALTALAALFPRLYRTELGLTRVRRLEHLPPQAVGALLHEEALVAGAYFNGKAVAYPVALLVQSRPFLDPVGGLPLVPVACRFSHATLALVSGLDSEPLDLALLGSPDNHLLFYDRASGNAFRPLAGVVEAGPEQGQRLEVRPLVRCRWSAWQKLHPDTLVAWWEPQPVHRLLYRLGERGLTARHVPEQPMSRPLDPRLPPGEQVFGLAVEGQAHAYTRRFLARHRVLEQRLGRRPLVVLFDVALDIAQAFQAELDGRRLRFEPYSGLHAVARDLETGSLWDVGGRCRKGELYGRRLAPVPLSVDRVYWFAWARFHPASGLDALASGAQGYALEARD